MDEPGDNTNEGGFTRTVGAQKSIDAAAGNVEGNLVQRFDGLEVF